MRRLVERSVVLAPWNSFRHRVLFAVIVVALATLLRHGLAGAFGITSVFLLYHPAVFVAAWFGRFGGGLLAAVLSILALKLFSVSPQITLTGARADEIANLALFLLIGAFQSFLIELFQQAVVAQKVTNRELADARSQLEQRVAERTAELVAANERLKVEVIERQQAEELERFHAQRSQALSSRIVELQEAEHRRIARELHDEIGQNLTGLKVVLQLASREVPHSVREKFEEAQHLAQDLLDRVRHLSLDLRPLMLDDLGLLAALNSLLDRFRRQTDIVVHFKHSPFPGRLGPELETTLYRIVQEALANVARHSGARNVHIRLWRGEDGVRLQVEDDGSGFDAEKALKANVSTGLSGMQERAALVGGELLFESSPGMGTRLTAELPITNSLPDNVKPT